MQVAVFCVFFLNTLLRCLCSRSTRSS